MVLVFVIVGPSVSISTGRGWIVRGRTNGLLSRKATDIVASAEI